MILLFFDTETTGLINYKLPDTHPNQARIVQLAAILTDENGEVLDQMDSIIKPDGWAVPDHVAAINGITTEHAEREGVPMPEALARFNVMKKICTHRLAFNISFDKQMLAREATIYGMNHDSSDIETICVMQMASPICKMAPTEKMLNAGFRHNKNPKLSEAYQIILGKKLEGAHNAMVDIKATAELYFHMKNAGQP